MTSRSPLLGLLFVGVAIAAVVCVYWPTVAELTTRFDTYRHIGLVFAAFTAIMWSQRFELASLPIRPFWPGLIVLVCLGFVWLVGETIFVRTLTDTAVVSFVAASIMTVLGYRWLRALIFPLAFLFFVIPIGGPLVPLLVDWTAKIAVMWVRFSGVPIYQEGAYFNIPSGSWSIVEACSGIGYLSTCVMLGCLYAWAFYGSALKRAAFVIGATIIGIVGNWIRVYLTVMIAHLSDNRLLRDDHSAFGWAVFAVLGSAYCWVGMIFRNDEPHEIVVGDRKCDARELRSASEKPTSRVQILAVSCAVIATLAIWPIFQLSLERHHQFSDISVADMQLQRGWTTTNLPFTTWTPELQNPLRTRVQIFEKDGHRVGVFIGIFRNQSWQSKLVTSVNQLATYENPDWKIFIRGTMEIEFLGGPLVVDTGLITGHGFRVLAWHWYWVDGVATANGPLAKSLQIRRLLRGKDDTAAWIALFSDANMSNEIANHTLEEFMRDMGESLQRALLVTTNENRHP